MSYYLRLAERLDANGDVNHKEAATAIRDLFRMKQELERIVVTLSEARDLLFKELNHE